MTIKEQIIKSIVDKEFHIDGEIADNIGLLVLLTNYIEFNESTNEKLLDTIQEAILSAKDEEISEMVHDSGLQFEN